GPDRAGARDVQLAAVRSLLPYPRHWPPHGARATRRAVALPSHPLAPWRFRRALRTEISADVPDYFGRAPAGTDPGRTASPRGERAVRQRPLVRSSWRAPDLSAPPDGAAGWYQSR